MAAVDAAEKQEHDSHEDDHGHGDHGPFIAHHFDNARQQFDSGKLGIWLFLVTEVLFFSGLFVAYILYRYNEPEIFRQAHYFLDTMLGAANTVVLLLSSLTVALAVRAAQMENHRQVIINVTITIACAAFFLGVKAVEYSHKWDMGLLPAGYFSFTGPHHETGVSAWLIALCIVPAILTVASLAAGIFFWVTDSKLWGSFLILLAVGLSGFLIGAVGGYFYQANYAPHLDIQKVASVSGYQVDDHGHIITGNHHGAVHPEEAKGDSEGNETEEASGDTHATGKPPYLVPKLETFFSIYYCMTGLHAIHIVGGIAFLSWLLFRSLRKDWRKDYYGPVEYVGLYWHLVDLIWIYLFPLFYLIS